MTEEVWWCQPEALPHPTSHAPFVACRMITNCFLVSIPAWQQHWEPLGPVQIDQNSTLINVIKFSERNHQVIIV